MLLLKEYKLICTFVIRETPLEFFDLTLYKFFVQSVWIDCNVTVHEIKAGGCVIITKVTIHKSIFIEQKLRFGLG